MHFLTTRFGKRIITTLILLSLVGYFIFHAMQGKHGLRARVGLKKQLGSLESELSTLRDKRKKLEHNIQLLQAQKIDPDMLDEQARKLLNLAHPSDVVIMLPKTKQ